MSAAEVSRWTTASNKLAVAAGTVLLRLCSGGPANSAGGASRRQPQPPKCASTLAATGCAAIRSASSTPRTAEETAALAPLLPATGRGRLEEKWWDDGWLHACYDRRSSTLTHLRTTQQRHYGGFNFGALLAAPAAADDVLHLADGVAVTRRDFPDLLWPQAAIGEIVRVEWQGQRHLRFRSLRHEWPMAPRIADQFRRFCDVLVLNYPALLFPHNEADELQPRPASETMWRFRCDDQVHVLVREPVTGVRVDVGEVQTMAQAEKLARAIDPQLRRFDPHPALDAFAPLWTRTSQHNEQSTRLQDGKTERALREVASREQAALVADSDLAGALASVSWAKLARLPASASHQRLLVHKIKGLRLSGWDRSTNRRGYPHCTTTRPGPDLGHTFHIVWHCPRAQDLWRQFKEGWQQVGYAADDKSFRTDVVSLRLSQTPSLAWTVLGLRDVPTDLVPEVHATLSLLWQQQALGCFQQIWRWRHAMADPDAQWSQSIASAALRSSQRAAYHQVGASASATDQHRAPLHRLLHEFQDRQLDRDHELPRRPHGPQDQFLLCFDGGSRRNPGAGGSYSVIVRVDTDGGHPTIVWAAAMSLAQDTTTNNQAEYTGLVTGLRYAVTKRLQPLTVIGDSLMIITQLRQHRAPKNAQLREFYGHARVLADRLGVTQWCHHVRAFNKMADCAANLAMDSRSSVQTPHPTSRPFWIDLASLLRGDVAQWQASTFPGQTSLG